MKSGIYSVLISAPFILAIVIQPSSAQAQTRVFVSPTGSDSNPCNFPAPCRTFQRAHDVVAANGEITVLDSGGYGQLTITKSITITNPGGVEAGVTASAGGTAIIINSSSLIDVTLRGLTLEGAGVGASGITMNSVLRSGFAGGSLTVMDCVIKDFAGSGILMAPVFSGGGTTPSLRVTIARTAVLNNGVAGIKFNPSGARVLYSIMGLIASDNATAIDVETGGFGTLTRSNVEQNGTIGVSVAAQAGITIRDSVLQSNNIAGFLNDINSSGNLAIEHHSEVDHVTNLGSGFSDGTNNIAGVTGNALVPLGLQ